MMQEEIENLIQKYLDRTISTDEMHQLDKWYELFDLKTDLYNSGTDESKQALSKALSEIRSKLGIL